MLSCLKSVLVLLLVLFTDCSTSAQSQRAALPTKAPTIKPIGLHGYVMWVEGGDDTTRLVMKSVVGGRLRAAGDFKATLKGALHTCEGEGVVGFATWDRKSNIASAKPSAGAGKTLLTMTRLSGNAWSKPVETTKMYRA